MLTRYLDNFIGYQAIPAFEDTPASISKVFEDFTEVLAAYENVSVPWGADNHYSEALSSLLLKDFFGEKFSEAHYKTMTKNYTSKVLPNQPWALKVSDIYFSAVFCVLEDNKGMALPEIEEYMSELNDEGILLGDLVDRLGI